jgi:hypothetical protein
MRCSAVTAMRVSNPDCSPLGIDGVVWKRHAKAFFWVRPLARSPDFARARAALDMILPSHCAQLLRTESFSARSHNALIRACGNAGNVIETHEHAGGLRNGEREPCGEFIL